MRQPLDNAVWSKKIEEFKNVVPDYKSFEIERRLLERHQTWSDSTRFGEPIQHKLRKHHLGKLIVGIAAVLAVYYGSMICMALDTQHLAVHYRCYSE